MKVSSSAQASFSVSDRAEGEVPNVLPQAIRYPIYLTQDTLANRLAALLEFSEGLPEDQLPVSIEFIERPV
jgi:hypothetical protein